MLRFNADARDGHSLNYGVCPTNCCCQDASAVPGEINKWWINYAPWVAGIGGKGLVNPTTFSIVRQTVDGPPPFPLNLPPINTDYYFATPHNTALIGSVATNALDPEAAPLTYALCPGTGPTKGSLGVFDQNTGAFTYNPVFGATGYDQFAYTTSDGVNAPVKHVVVIGISSSGGPALPASPGVPYPILRIPMDRVRLTYNTLEFPLIVSPDAIVGDIYRMTITQDAMDCDGENYRHTSCFDIRIVKC